MADAYTTYCQWMTDRGWPAPTREWWNMACRARARHERQNDEQFDHDTEMRDGWAFEPRAAE